MQNPNQNLDRFLVPCSLMPASICVIKCSIKNPVVDVRLPEPDSGDRFQEGICRQLPCGVLWIPARAAELLTIEPLKHCEKR